MNDTSTNSTKRKLFNIELVILITLTTLIVAITASAIHADYRYSLLEEQITINTHERRASMKDISDRLKLVENALPTSVK